MLKKILIGLSLLLVSLVSIAQPLNINTAKADEIAHVMIGVGPAKAEAIIKDRTERGDFTTLDDMTRVKGIGIATIEKNRDKISIK